MALTCVLPAAPEHCSTKETITRPCVVEAESPYYCSTIATRAVISVGVIDHCRRNIVSTQRRASVGTPVLVQLGTRDAVAWI